MFFIVIGLLPLLWELLGWTPVKNSSKLYLVE
jgi:hypothetical protein